MHNSTCQGERNKSGKCPPRSRVQVIAASYRIAFMAQARRCIATHDTGRGMSPANLGEHAVPTVRQSAAFQHQFHVEVIRRVVHLGKYRK